MSTRPRHSLRRRLTALCSLLTVLALALTDNVTALVEFASRLTKTASPEVPQWVQRLPVVGPWIDDYWHQLVQSRDELRRLRDLLDGGKP
jgi:predicted PurR-regulated permease PerM